MSATAAFLEATIRTATPLAIAALGETVVERAGVINLSLEGAIIAGAFGALVGAGIAGVGAGFATAALAGVIVGVCFATFTILLGTDQIITGTALTLLAFGLTGTLYRTHYESGAALSIPTAAPLEIPLLSGLPVVGGALFAQSAVTYLLYVGAPALWWWMYRTHGGLALRAVGESPLAARAAGIAARRVQVAAIVFGGLMGGVSGGTLVLAQVGTFAEGMSAGRGFVAIAIVVLGRWHPLGALLASVLFGGASALQYLFQAMDWPVPYQLFLALPYLLTLVALAGAGHAHARNRTRAPAFLGRPLTEDGE